MDSERILVTGGTGFIGGRLVEKLVLCRQAKVRALVRTWERAVRLARFDIEMHQGDIGSRDDIQRAVRDCEIVIHCAHDLERPQRNINGIRELIEACLEHRVRRLVVVSSLSVYEPLVGREVNEASPREPSGWAFPDNKLAIEIELERAQSQTELPMVIVEPTIVYGPFSEPWTLAPIRRLRAQRLVLPDDGEGVCNQVYVDDVVDSLILSIDREDAVGARVLVSGNRPVTWRQFFAAYEKMLGLRSLVLLPTARIEEMLHRRSAPAGVPTAILRDPRMLLRSTLAQQTLKAIRPLLSHRVVERAKRSLPASLSWPTEQELALYGSRARVNIGHARDVLGYEPQVSFEVGMKLTQRFATWAAL